MDAELMRYIVDNFSYLMTDEEKLISRHLHTNLYDEAIEPKNELRIIIADSLKDDSESFEYRVAERIIDENKEAVYLNYCPNCEQIARTPSATQCRYCEDTWRN